MTTRVKAMLTPEEMASVLLLRKASAIEVAHRRASQARTYADKPEILAYWQDVCGAILARNAEEDG